MRVFSEILVGILFFSAVGILLYFTVFIMQDSAFYKQGKYEIDVIFDDVYGLSEGNRVLVSGVDYGKVKSIKLLPNGKVLVKLSLKEKINIYKNYKIVVKSETALGGRVVAITPGDKILGLANLKKPLKGTILLDPFEAVSIIINENKDNLKKAIANLKDVIVKINRGKGTIGKLINKDSIHKDTEKLINKAQTLVDELKDVVEDVREQAPITSFIRAALTAF
jgi:phospholipid/cholesterol/gamma-HCH transport system substrate-binding protein